MTEAVAEAAAEAEEVTEADVAAEGEAAPIYSLLPSSVGMGLLYLL